MRGPYNDSAGPRYDGRMVELEHAGRVMRCVIAALVLPMLACERPAAEVTAPGIDPRAVPPPAPVFPSVLHVITADTDPEHLMKGTTPLTAIDPSAAPQPTTTGPVASAVPYYYGNRTMYGAKVIEGPFILTDATTDQNQQVFLYIVSGSGTCAPIGEWQHHPEGAELVGYVNQSPGLHGSRTFVRGGATLCAGGFSYNRANVQLSWSGFTPYGG